MEDWTEDSEGDRAERRKTFRDFRGEVDDGGEGPRWWLLWWSTSSSPRGGLGVVVGSLDVVVSEETNLISGTVLTKVDGMVGSSWMLVFVSWIFSFLWRMSRSGMVVVVVSLIDFARWVFAVEEELKESSS